MIFNEQKKDKVPFASRDEYVTVIAFACVHMVVLAILMAYTSMLPALAVLISALALLIEVMVLGLIRRKRTGVAPRSDVHSIVNHALGGMLRNTAYPSFILDMYGCLLWYNDAARKILPEDENYIGFNIEVLLGDLALSDSEDERRTVRVDKTVYRTEVFSLDSQNELSLLMLSDITELSVMEQKYNDEQVAVAYIAIDNVEDVLQYVHEKYKNAVNEVDDCLKRWASDMNGVIKSYTNNKYIMLFSQKAMLACIEDRFSILDSIRDTRLGDGISITVSIGVSCSGETLAEREAMASEAIDLALQRGGDQAVYKSREGVEYYGGRTKSVYKRSNVRSRTFTNQLTALIARSDNVLIMGHRYGDFDSFGACVGIAKLAQMCGTKTNIAVDMRDKNLAPCIRLMQAEPSYSQVFVDNAEGLDLVTSDTLLIIVDVGTLGRAQFEDIAARVNSVAIIDHHRKMEKVEDRVKLSYIEPSASSACELVTEMLQNAATSQTLLKSEADLLLAGILLDTKQFTRNTGTRTFAAAQYLRGAGASPSDVYDLFKTDPKDLSKEARFHTSITMYRDCVAISSCEGETDASFRVIASKAADKMLTLKNVEAAFTLVRIGDQIHISGRSTGKINVQLILEKFHGGGHFDVAGAQVVADSTLSVIETLKAAIDDFFDA
ncbi:MAG: DHH family phosphoesterase [Clostridia bacterium]|nr:DHH family phosphoesterase [Clostridia bacterium]